MYGDHGYGIASLSDDSTVVTGDFYESAAFGKGEAIETVLISTDGNRDVFVARYNWDGTIEWAKRAGGSNYDSGYGITALSDDSSVVTGYFDISAIFGPGESGETELISAGSWEIFVARYKP